MASALLSVSRFLPLQNRELGGFIRNFRSPYLGEVIGSKSFVRRAVRRRVHGDCFVVASVLGQKVKNRETVIPDPDYRIASVLLGLSGGLIYTNNLLPAAPVGLLGLLLLVQEVKVGEQLQESGENVFVGGKNRWKYSTFVNWELWWPNFPILVYFKETQTRPEGQVHFFPVIFNGKQLYDVMVERAGPSKTSGPK
ncbi:uncharacterized protein LOC100254186 isoform X2 [Vitis vinifera]|uniref:uncharacterized protein LOC100254186 isoform X2 n=1 Tax=Vitis vinifera TaxID=29760 RepID=UPI00053FDCC9|nr:uncharacterized protein LOC100254186 isoform X2 [Vitis vinifera]|eukprot:XP_010656425.1 PREDICTED: uncharacterized protein LOC100254186 isoform X2 [Vitis vinifera]